MLNSFLPKVKVQIEKVPHTQQNLDWPALNCNFENEDESGFWHSYPILYLCVIRFATRSLLFDFYLPEKKYGFIQLTPNSTLRPQFSWIFCSRKVTYYPWAGIMYIEILKESWCRNEWLSEAASNTAWRCWNESSPSLKDWLNRWPPFCPFVCPLWGLCRSSLESCSPEQSLTFLLLNGTKPTVKITLMFL
jgi:hypothetical protein